MRETSVRRRRALSVSDTANAHGVARLGVIPLFRRQVLGGAPVTVTTTDMTRFMLSIDQAVDTVFAALKTAKRGEVLVPDAVSSRMVDVAKAMIGDCDNEIKIVGIRPGRRFTR